MSPRPTYAEGLLNKVGCLVGGLLIVDCQASQKSTPPASPSSSQPSSGGSNSSPNSSASQAPSSSSATPATAQPLSADPALSTPIADVQTLAPINSPSNTQLATNAAYAVPKIGSRLVQLSYDTGPTTPIQATDQGWRILGVLWYWWLAVIVGLVGSTMIFSARTKAPDVTLHKRSSLLK